MFLSSHYHCGCGFKHFLILHNYFVDSKAWTLIGRLSPSWPHTGLLLAEADRSDDSVYKVLSQKSFEPGKCAVKISIEIPRAWALGLQSKNKLGTVFNASDVSNKKKS